MTNASLATQINNAIGAHGAWKMRLRTAIRSGTSDVSASDAARDDLCAFGCWLHGPAIGEDLRAGVPYQVVRRLHADFHRTAGMVLSHAARGESDMAATVMEGAFAEASDKLVRALTKWKNEVATSARAA